MALAAITVMSPIIAILRRGEGSCLEKVEGGRDEVKDVGGLRIVY